MDLVAGTTNKPNKDSSVDLDVLGNDIAVDSIALQYRPLGMMRTTHFHEPRVAFERGIP